MRVTKAV